MSEGEWIAAQAARDTLAPKRWERRSVAQQLADMVRDGAIPARCSRFVHNYGGRISELADIVIDDGVRSLMRRADRLSWSCQTLDLNALNFSYLAVEPRRDRFALSPTRTINSVAIYGLMLSSEHLPTLGGRGQVTAQVDASRTATERRGPLFNKMSDWAAISDWYLARISEAHAVGFTRAEDEAAGKQVGIGRDRVRELRNVHAPLHWKADGPKSSHL